MGLGWYVPMYKGDTERDDFVQLSEKSSGNPCICLYKETKDITQEPGRMYKPSEKITPWTKIAKVYTPRSQEDIWREVIQACMDIGFKEKDLVGCRKGARYLNGWHNGH